MSIIRLAGISPSEYSHLMGRQVVVTFNTGSVIGPITLSGFRNNIAIFDDAVGKRFEYDTSTIKSIVVQPESVIQQTVVYEPVYGGGWYGGGGGWHGGGHGGGHHGGHHGHHGLGFYVEVPGQEQTKVTGLLKDPETWKVFGPLVLMGVAGFFLLRKKK